MVENGQLPIEDFIYDLKEENNIQRTVFAMDRTMFFPYLPSLIEEFQLNKMALHNLISSGKLEMGRKEMEKTRGKKWDSAREFVRQCFMDENISQ